MKREGLFWGLSRRETIILICGIIIIFALVLWRNLFLPGGIDYRVSIIGVAFLFWGMWITVILNKLWRKYNELKEEFDKIKTVPIDK